MQYAIAKTREGINEGNSPFGAAVVKDGKIVSDNPTRTDPIHREYLDRMAVAAAELAGPHDHKPTAQVVPGAAQSVLNK